jgi:sigma-B regulation protein RsbU (phosphoserine phosphatase)
LTVSSLAALLRLTLIFVLHSALGFAVFSTTFLLILIGSLALLAVAFILRRRLASRRALERRVVELSALAEAGRVLASATLQVDRLCELIYEQASAIVDTSTFQLGLFEEHHYAIELWQVNGVRQPPAVFDLSEGEGIVGWMRRTGQPLLVHDFETEADSLPAHPRYISPDAPSSAVFVPLLAGADVIGAIAIQSYQPSAFTEEHVRLLSIIASQAGSAIANARLLESERMRAKQLDLVGQVSRQIAAILEIEELFVRVVELVQSSFGYYHVGVCIPNERTNTVEFRACTHPDLIGRGPRIGEGIIGYVAQSGEALLVNDVTSDAHYVSLDVLQETRSELAAPLKFGHVVLGVLDVQSDQRDAFGSSDLFILQTLADQVAIAIREAQLYEAERRRRQVADTLRDIAVMLAGTLDLDPLLDRILDSFSRVVSFDAIAVLLKNDLGTLTVHAARGLPKVCEAVGKQVPIREGGRFIRLQETRGPLIFGEDDSTGAFHELIGLPSDHSCLGAPLIARDELIGFLSVEQIRPRSYTQDDAEVVFALAGQAALAISNARLYEAEREQAWISTALLQVAEATTRAANVEEVLSTVVRITPVLSGVNRCAVLLWDATQDVFRASHEYGLDRERSQVFATLRIPPGRWDPLDELRESQRPIRIAKLEGEAQAVFGTGCMLALPLISRGQVAGALLVGAQDGAPLSSRHADMISGIANQAALAIESAQLAAAQREEAWVNMALLQVAEAVGSQTELSEILTTVVRLTPLLVGVEACLVFLWDDERRAFVAGAAYGLPRDRLSVFHSLHVPGGAWPEPGPSSESDGAVITSQHVPRNISATLGLQSPRAFPLRAKGKVVGMMVVEGTHEELSQGGRAMNILSGIAHQTAIAIENTRLVTELATRQRLEQELKVARDIQTSFLPSCCPEAPGWQLAAFWRAARQVGGDFYDFIPLPREHVGLVIADVADKGVPAALFMAVSRTLTRAASMTGHRTPGESLTRTNEMILSDARSDLFVTMVFADLSPVGRVTYANAGHNPPLVVRATGEVERLHAHGMALGVMPEVAIHDQQIRLENGDLLVLYTDGVTDALDARGREFGLERLEQAAVANRGSTADGIVAAIQDAVHEFVGDEPPFDDLTLVVAKRSVES